MLVEARDLSLLMLMLGLIFGRISSEADESSTAVSPSRVLVSGSQDGVNQQQWPPADYFLSGPWN